MAIVDALRRTLQTASLRGARRATRQSQLAEGLDLRHFDATASRRGSLALAMPELTCDRRGPLGEPRDKASFRVVAPAIVAALRCFLQSTAKRQSRGAWAPNVRAKLATLRGMGNGDAARCLRRMVFSFARGGRDRPPLALPARGFWAPGMVR